MDNEGAKRLVITVHGIRTFGGWQERLEQLVTGPAPSGSVEVHNYKFGYFSVIGFIIPFSRWIVMRRFRKTLQRLCAKRSWDRIDLIGHSFGTHLIAWSLHGLRNTSAPRIHTVILAGSVLRSEFPWEDLVGSSVERVVNDCGARDNVLLLSQFGVLFTGMAGRVGFVGATGSYLRNRYSMIGHSGYFLNGTGAPDDSYMRQHWLPLLRDNAPAAQFDHRPATTGEGLLTWLAGHVEPIKILIYLAPVVAAFLWILGLYQTAESERQRALAGKLYAEAQLLIDRTPNRLGLAALLALEADRLAPDAQIEALLRKMSSLLTMRELEIRKSGGDSFPLAWLDSEGGALVTVDGRGAVEKWSLDDGRRLEVSLPAVGRDDGYLPQRAGGTQASPDRRFIARPAEHGTIEIYDLKSLDRGAVVDPQITDWSSAALSYGGKYLAVAEAGTRIRVWYLAKNQAALVATIKLDDSMSVPGFQITSLAISGDGSLVAYSGNIGGESIPYTTWIAEVATGRLIKRIPNPSFVNDIEFDPAGRRIATASAGVLLSYIRDDGPVVLLDAGAFTRGVTFSPDGRNVVTNDVSGAAMVWNTRSGDEIAQVLGAHLVDDASFNAAGNMVVAAGTWNDSEDIYPYAAVSRLSAADGYIQAGLQMPNSFSWFDATEDGRYVAVADFDGLVLFETAIGMPVGKFPSNIDAAPRFSPDGTRLTYRADRKWMTLAVPDGRVIETQPDGASDYSYVESSKFGDFYISHRTMQWTGNSYSSDFAVFKRGEVTPRIARHYPQTATASTINPSGRFAAVALLDEGRNESQVCLIDVEQQHEDACLSFQGQVSALAIDAAGRHLAAAGEARTLLWSISDRKVVHDIPGDRLSLVALNDDGTLLAVAHAQGGMIVYDVKSGEALARETYESATQGEGRLKFVGGDTLVIAGIAGKSRPVIMEWNKQDLRARICGRLKSNLSEEEWADRLPGEEYRATCPAPNGNATPVADTAGVAASP